MTRQPQNIRRQYRDTIVTLTCHRPWRLSVCLLLISILCSCQIQVATAGYFRTGTNRPGLGFAARGSSSSGTGSYSNNGNTNNDLEEEEHEEEREVVRPGANFWDSARQSNMLALAKEEDDDDDDDDNEDDEEFFQLDQTDFPSVLPPTESPMPTEESTPTPAPSTEPPQEWVGAETILPSTQKADPAPPKGDTDGPTVAPTLVLKEVTSPPTAAGTNALPSTSSSPTSFLTGAPTLDMYMFDNVTDGEELGFDDFDETESPTPDPLNNNTNINSTDDTDFLLGFMDIGNVSFTSDPETMAPSTEAPADPPTAQPSTEATVTAEAEFPVAGQVSLHLEGITSPFSGDTRLLFLASADEFIASSSQGTVEEIRVMLIYQKMVAAKDEAGSNDRLLQESALRVDLGVEGLAHEETYSASEWNHWLKDLFDQDSPEFVTMLQELGEAEGNLFFEPLQKVDVAEPDPIILPSTPAPTLPVQTNDNDGEGIPMIAIIGAAVGGFVFLIVGLLLIRYVVTLQRRKRSSASRDSNSIADNFGATPSPDEDARKRNSRTNNHATNNTNMRTIQNKPSVEGSISSESYLTNSHMHQINYNGTMSSNPYQSAPASEFDTLSQMGGTITDMSQMDNASYAYSLEPGIEPSVAGVPQSVAASAMSFSAYPGGSSVASMTSGASSFAFMKMPISKSGSGGLSGGLAGKPTRDVLAPPGKLGIVIDTTLDGPVVHMVNAGSALEGKLKSGDIIVAIDDVDTRAMTAASITALMVKTANQRRKLTIVSS